MNKTKISRVQLIESHAVPPSTTMNPVTSDARSKTTVYPLPSCVLRIDGRYRRATAQGRGWGSGEVPKQEPISVIEARLAELKNKGGESE